MKLSGHSYDNDVFESLLDGLKGNVVKDKMEKTAGRVYTVSGSDVFSSTTEQDFQNVQDEELQFIASELAFAADRAKVAITQEDLHVFAKQVTNDGLRGKKLERAAQKFCSNIVAATAPPMGTTRNVHSPNLLDNAHSNAIIPAGYDPEQGPNDTKTGGFMGMSKNPNTIWDTEAMQRFASTPSNDEKMKATKEANTQFKKDQKQGYWEKIQAQLSEEGVIHEKAASVANVSTKESAGNQKLPANSMSILSDDREFNNIPEKTAGETIKESATIRAEKKTEAKKEWNQVQSAQKADNSLNSVFEESRESIKRNQHRETIDRLFEGLTG
ncbi:hypothetical protein LCGC14_0630490 [marine sediment metagenome]|uniref:Uncharacterized protein n=1 Tax=marine sediment metagenome TaxID=412755 RepID=A0A0F9R207_9ZZZZ